jgi:hypothetical protein
MCAAVVVHLQKKVPASVFFQQIKTRKQELALKHICETFLNL